MGLRQALPVQPPSAAEAASVAALLQSRPTPYRTRGPITVGRSCQQGPWELQLEPAISAPYTEIRAHPVAAPVSLERRALPAHGPAVARLRTALPADDRRLPRRRAQLWCGRYP